MDDLVYIFPLFGLLAMAAAFAQAGNEANLYPPLIYVEFDEAIEILRRSDLNGIRAGGNGDDWRLDDYSPKGAIKVITDETANRLIDGGHVETPDVVWTTAYYYTTTYDGEEA